MLNSIAQMFSPVPAATPSPAGVTPANNANTTPGNIPANPTMTSSGATTGAASNGIVPAGTSTTDKPQSPLDAFSDFWKNDTNSNTTVSPLFTATKEEMLAAAAKADFRSVIKPEDVAAIVAGGEEAKVAFLNSLNSLAQNIYAQSAFSATKLIESAVTRNNDTIRGEIPNIVKKHNVRDGLSTENSAFSHPAAQPIIHAIEQQMVQKFPNATASELRTMATTYLQSFATAISPTADKTNSDAANTGNAQKETDWSSFL